MTKLAYLANPYTHTDPRVMQARYDAACEYTAKLMRAGWHVYSPIAHSHGPAQYGLPKDYQYWKKHCELMLPKTDIVIVLMIPGWRESVGVTAEIALAKECTIPVMYSQPGAVPMPPVNGTASIS